MRRELVNLETDRPAARISAGGRQQGRAWLREKSSARRFKQRCGDATKDVLVAALLEAQLQRGLIVGGIGAYFSTVVKVRSRRDMESMGVWPT